MVSPYFFTIFLSISLFTPSSSVTLTQVSQLKTFTYDYIVVGGASPELKNQAFNRDRHLLAAGTAGLVVANRLTEDLKTTVLVLEAGVR